ncbi:hypothetical protein ASF49_02630 [Methylobacterium sp. Leaf104]|nr:hypothetical protein ASF49_02630 [Methylobacterium sp. Leaf104]
MDGFVALGAIARSPEVFPDIRADLARTVRALVVKQLKAKNLTLDGLRRVRKCLGTETYALIVDGLTEAEARALIGRLDRHHAEAKLAKADWLRRRLADLAGGAEPAVRAKALPRRRSGSPAGDPSFTRALGSPAFTASWDRKDHDRTGKAASRATRAKAARGKKKGG